MDDDDDDDLAAYVAVATAAPPPHPPPEAERSAQVVEYALQPRRLHELEAGTPSHTGEQTFGTPRRGKKSSASAKKTPTPRRERAARVPPPPQVSAIALQTTDWVRPVLFHPSLFTA